MRITFVMPHANLSGGIRVCAIYADLLQRFGHTVTCVSTPRHDLSRWAKLKNMVRGKPWRIELRGPSHFDAFPNVTHHVVDRFRPIGDADLPDADVAIATWWQTAQWVADLSASKGVKTYFIQHDETEISPLRKEEVDATWRLPMRKAVVAEWLAQVGKDRHGMDDLTVVPNGVDLDQFHAPARNKQSVPTVGFMYSRTRFKGADIAIEAIRLARQQVPELKVVAFGSEQPDPSIPLPAGTLYAARPPQDQLRTYYASCDAWLFASRSEGFGLPILEAMACRTPVIGTPAGAAPELIAQGAGALVPLDNPATMASEIVRFARMREEEWGRLSDRAVETAKRFRWDVAARAFEAFLIRAASQCTRAA